MNLEDYGVWVYVFDKTNNTFKQMPYQSFDLNNYLNRHVHISFIYEKDEFLSLIITKGRKYIDFKCDKTYSSCLSIDSLLEESLQNADKISKYLKLSKEILEGLCQKSKLNQK